MSSEDLARVQTLHHALDHVEHKLAPLVAMSRESLGKVDKAKLNVAMAYTMASMFFVLLKTKGKQTVDHEVIHDLKRIGQSLSKVKSAAAAERGEPPSMPEQPRLRLDATSGKRIISFALAANSGMLDPPAPFGGLAAAAERTVGDKDSRNHEVSDITEQSAAVAISKKRMKKMHSTSASDFM